MSDHRLSDFTGKIVSAYVRRNEVATDELGLLISNVYQALSSLEHSGSPAPVERAPAVPIRQSVHRDYVVCLDCGLKGQTLRRHLARAHGLTVNEYRARWNLLAHHAITAPGYHERRSVLAKQLGFGRRRSTSGAVT